MKSLSKQNKKILDNEIDMIKGNINRMCVTDEKEELLNMYAVAISRVNKIYLLNKRRIEGTE